VTTIAQDQNADLLTEEAAGIRRNWGWFLALGIVQMIVGALAVSFAFSAPFASVATLGVLLLIAAGAQMATAVLARHSGGFFLFLLLGILYPVAGILTLGYSLLAPEGLALLLAAALLVAGMFRIIIALVERFPSRGWVPLNGFITVLLGIAIWRQWPESGLWVLGLFVGIDLIVNGATWSALAVEIRNGLARFPSP